MARTIHDLKMLVFHPIRLAIVVAPCIYSAKLVNTSMQDLTNEFLYFIFPSSSHCVSLNHHVTM